MRENPIGRLLHTTFGVRGTQNLLSWAVAGGLAYYFFYLPEQRKKEERQVSTLNVCPQKGHGLGHHYPGYGVTRVCDETWLHAHRRANLSGSMARSGSVGPFVPRSAHRVANPIRGPACHAFKAARMGQKVALRNWFGRKRTLSERYVRSQHFGAPRSTPAFPAARYGGQRCASLSNPHMLFLHLSRQALFDATRQRHADRLASVADRQKAAADVAQQQPTDLQN